MFGQHLRGLLTNPGDRQLSAMGAKGARASNLGGKLAIILRYSAEVEKKIKTSPRSMHDARKFMVGSRHPCLFSDESGSSPGIFVVEQFQEVLANTIQASATCHRSFKALSSPSIIVGTHAVTDFSTSLSPPALSLRGDTSRFNSKNCSI